MPCRSMLITHIAAPLDERRVHKFHCLTYAAAFFEQPSPVGAPPRRVGPPVATSPPPCLHYHPVGYPLAPAWRPISSAAAWADVLARFRACPGGPMSSDWLPPVGRRPTARAPPAPRKCQRGPRGAQVAQKRQQGPPAQASRTVQAMAAHGATTATGQTGGWPGTGGASAGGNQAPG
jgi:hypothetical protein